MAARLQSWHSVQAPHDRWAQAHLYNGITLKGIYGREMYETWYLMTVMLESGLDISPVITHRLPWHEYEQGFAAMRSGEACKVVLDWQV